ncbi:multiple epidermal growth factor-like domains protein 10 isoform X2 [Mytilus californianus]|uniref:multiple epidermal growth factor-like domains protein 10 isoform X2 n=1 Tax=Mytilus californianus TaxID=6549 RepID=UPI002246501C|nr:multiple epidermal growth factor-like domains protein 10 isoform X2 [Mytilus californianus]
MYIVKEAEMLLLLSISTVLLSVSAQHNLTPFGKASQSSQFITARPTNAIHTPISNTFSFSHCSHTNIEKTAAWWMFQLSFGTAYITDITIYYREKFARRMDGFKLFVTNTSTIPPNGYLCYEDPDPGLPNITQTIPCNQLGQYVIYFDNKGSRENETRYDGPVVELCYVAINGCQKSFWGNNCGNKCSKNCIGRLCHPTNGSCVWGCNTKHCLNDICDIQTAVCTDGCKERRTGNYCNKYNIASDGLIVQTPSGSQRASLANDGNNKSCSKTKGLTVTFQVDLQKESIVTGVHINFGESTTREGNHTLYASNTSTSWKCGTILYKETSLPTEIHFYAVFRYLTYVPPVKKAISELEVCEIGIVGCPPSLYGPLCNQSCQGNCRGPCDLTTGQCIFGCSSGWSGDNCKQACQAGTYGKNCLETCSSNCLNLQCNAGNGECFEGCNDGWHGSDCKQKCPTGQFGRNCSEFCEGCISRTCDPRNGVCDNKTVCNTGYVYGKYCNITCNDGFYGSNCLKLCSSFCLYQPCNYGTGECIGGCVSGLEGFNCTQVSANKEDDSFILSTQIGLFSGGFLLGALVVTVVCILVLKKRQIRKKRGKKNATKKAQSDEKQQYDDVRMENVSTYQDLTEDSTSNEYDQINTAYINH